MLGGGDPMIHSRTLTRRCLLLGAAAGLAGLGLRPARATGASDLPAELPAGFPPAGTFDYRILRDGEDIGRHTVEFGRAGGILTVRTLMDATLELLSVPVFRFKHEAEEKWVDERLVSLSSRTDDDGTDRTVELQVEGDRLRVVYNGEAREYDGPMLPASLWHPATVRQTVLFDAVKGRPRRVTVAERGRDSVEIGSARVAADHFSITGELAREVWYGLDEQIVQVTFQAKDKSLITIVRRA